MDKTEFIELNGGNFCENSLDNFIRLQKVEKCWRKLGGNYVIKHVVYSEDWNLAERRALAARILHGLECGDRAFGAVIGGEIAGFAYIENKLFGKDGKYIDLAEFYVSARYRRMGIGKELFALACRAAKSMGAQKLYISAHSAVESIAAYAKYGCVRAEEINRELAEKEPYDLQLEFDLKNIICL